MYLLPYGTPSPQGSHTTPHEAASAGIATHPSATALAAGGADSTMRQSCLLSGSCQSHLSQQTDLTHNRIPEPIQAQLADS